MSHAAGASGSPARPAVRAWREPAARILDGLSLVLAVLLASSVFFGGVRFYMGTTRFSAGSSWRVAVALAAVLILRRLVPPPPAAADRLRTAATAALDGLRGRLGRAVTPIWIATRLGVLVVGFAALATAGRPVEAPSARLAANPLTDLPLRWDAGWYLGIAVDGYHWNPDWRGQQNVAFFPGLPWLMRVGGALLGARPNAATDTPDRLDRLRGRTLLAGWLLALAASYAALCALYRWAHTVVGPRAAATSVALLSAYPFAVYFSAVYTEPFFLLSVIAAFNAIRRQRAGPAAAWGLFAGFVRPNGFLMAIPLLVLALQQRPLNRRVCLAAVTPVLGVLIFSAYLMSLTGHPLVWLEAHAAWGRTPPTWQGAFAQPIEQVANQGPLRFALAAPYQLLNGTALLFVLGLLPLVWRRLGIAPALLVVVTVVPPLFAGGLMSMGRLTSTLFPVFVAMATVVPRRHLWAWLVFFALGQGLAAVLFFTWRPLI
jgi:hypothetical protein